MTRPSPTTWLLALAAAILAAPALAQGAAWQDRSQWDWGQHRTGFAMEPAAAPALPATYRDDWDDPGAPVRVAGQARRG